MHRVRERLSSENPDDGKETEMLEKGLRMWLIPTDHVSIISAGGRCMHLAGGPCWVAGSCLEPSGEVIVGDDLGYNHRVIKEKTSKIILSNC